MGRLLSTSFRTMGHAPTALGKHGICSYMLEETTGFIYFWRHNPFLFFLSDGIRCWEGWFEVFGLFTSDGLL